MSDAALQAEFVNNVETVFGRGRAEAIRVRAWAVDALDDVRPVIALPCKNGRIGETVPSRAIGGAEGI